MSDFKNEGRDAAGGRGPDYNEARNVAGREFGSAREEAARAGEGVRAEAGRFAENARQQAIDAAESGRERAAGGLEDFTAAIRRASEELGERDQSMAAQVVREAASGLEKATSAIRGSNVSDLMRSTGDFARRQPGAFLIGATLAGVALGRFLRASADHADGDRLREVTSGGEGRATDGRSIPADGLNHTDSETPLTRAGSSAFEKVGTSAAGVPREPQPGSLAGTGAGLGTSPSTGAGTGLGTSPGTGTSTGIGTGVGRDASSPGLTPSPAFGTSGSSGTTGTSGLSPNSDKDKTR